MVNNKGLFKQYGGKPVTVGRNGQPNIVYNVHQPWRKGNGNKYFVGDNTIPYSVVRENIIDKIEQLADKIKKDEKSIQVIKKLGGNPSNLNNNMSKKKIMLSNLETRFENVLQASQSKISNNEEISNLKKILGLKDEYPDINEYLNLDDYIKSGYYSVQGIRYWPGEGFIVKYPNGNQDRVLDIVTPIKDMLVTGIFDGSGGDNAEKLSKFIVEEITKKNKDGFTLFEKFNDKYLREKYKTFYNDIDKKILEISGGGNVWEYTAGSTGIMFVINNKKEGVISWIDDSRLVILKKKIRGDWNVDYCTKDYEDRYLNNDVQKEKHKLNKFGNYYQKDNDKKKKHWIIPFIKTFDFSNGEYMVVMFSDGLSNTILHSEAPDKTRVDNYKIVNTTLVNFFNKHQGSLKDLSKSLVKQVKINNGLMKLKTFNECKGYSQDDTTCLLVHIKP